MSILILYASAGNGHRRAAQALYEGFILAGREDVVMLDILDFTPKWFKRFYSGGYGWVINNAKWLWRFAFDISNRSSRRSFLIDGWHSLLNVLATKSLGKYLRQGNVSLVVTTHFMANDVLAYYKRKSGCRCRLACVVTDYVVHRFWSEGKVDRYFVGCEEAKRELVAMGVEENKISVIGIPVPASFLRTLPREQIIERFGLENRFTVLMLASAVEPGLIIDSVKVLMRDTQVVVGCGRNERLRKELQPLQEISPTLKIYGMIDEMELMMSMANVLVTKPGGLVVSEAIVKRLPMVLVDPIPGQEEGNRDFLVNKGVAKYARGSVDLIRHILKLKQDKVELERMRLAFDSLPQGDVAGRIVEDLLSSE